MFKGLILTLTVFISVSSFAVGPYGQEVDGIIVGPYEAQRRLQKIQDQSSGADCATRTLGITCDKFDAISNLSSESATGKYQRVFLETKLFHSEKVTGCEGKPLFYLNAVICTH